MLVVTLTVNLLSLQCISPGIVETEFAFRHHNSDPEKAAAVYENIKVSICACCSRQFGLVISSTVETEMLLSFSVFEGGGCSQRSHVCPQCPSSCSGMFVCHLFWFLLEVVKFSSAAHLSPFLLLDWRCADETSGAGVIAVILESRDHDSLAASAGRVGREGAVSVWIYRSLTKESCSLKEAVLGYNLHGL